MENSRENSENSKQPSNPMRCTPWKAVGNSTTKDVTSLVVTWDCFTRVLRLGFCLV
ncbi:hypothetical protein BO83DRAFT_379752 [Aspergillus eucalypticola CBS 122712]|uniref:Uncharacterized protein n=1 Tax=Aspergillus eucalypticola (strain CBS 122712 / IBT 29274) TaxID=1448314 RepID=A0A317V7Y0_ASPEC|nr:uncharacterized protein BO83DRAFT_379752 [Aspergillus eucalypticola CBS 122712]PWY70155.1 hypothetical protein BO83DRAFT_379752 [Aspergillus eucalypticola CBS 122712]